MDDILAKASSTAVTFVIRSSITYASGYAIKTVSKLLELVPQSKRKKFETKTKKLDAKIAIISSCSDLIQLSAARGNTILKPTVDIIKSLQEDISSFNQQISLLLNGDGRTQTSTSLIQAQDLIEDISNKLEEVIPLLQLSITTSGIHFNSGLPNNISPGRLIQASSYFNTTNTVGVKNGDLGSRIGPAFDVKLYSIFYNPSRLKYIDHVDSVSAITWKEDLARATIQVYKTKKFQYSLEIEEDFEDGRYHDDDEVPRKYHYQILDIIRLFFSASGKLLKLEGSNSPVLILKVKDVDKEIFVALGSIGDEYDDNDSDDDEEDEEGDNTKGSIKPSDAEDDDEFFDAKSLAPAEKSQSLSLLEYLIRLLLLEMNEQKTLAEIEDEKYSIYLADETLVLSQLYEKSNQKTEDSIEEDTTVSKLKNLDLNS